MRLFYVTLYRLPNRQAHAVQIFNTCSALAQTGIEISCLARHKDVARGTPVAPDQWPLTDDEYFGVTRNFSLMRPRRTLGFTLRRPPAHERFLHECDRYVARAVPSPDVVFTRHAEVALCFARRGVPVALEVHDLDMLDESAMQSLMNHFITSSLTAFPASKNNSSARAFCGVVAISQTLANGLHEAGVPRERLLVAHDGIDPTRFDNPLSPKEARTLIAKHVPQAAELLQPARLVVGYCGHFYEGRGVEMLLECAHRHPEWTFLLIGGFEQDVERCRQKALRLALHNVIFTGYVPNPALATYLWACDVMTMPYEYERPLSRFMSPMKMFEGMAAQRPLVAADWPQFREVLREGHTALFHARGDVDGLERALEHALGNPALRARLSASARHDVAEYTWQTRAQRIRTWLEANLGGSAAPNLR